MSAFFNTGLTQQQFLEQYWQKKPLLIRQAFADFSSPISAEELAGLACEEDIESRLIEEYSDEGPWRLRHGPFDDDDFANLPISHWTLLVQDVDKHVPELKQMIKPFEFIPDWRRDDLMISFASEQGSVGPHTDGYDVFLIQAMGIRRWQISDAPVVEAKLLDGLDLKILAEFTPDQSWDLEPGDLLYLPPHFAHHGVALNDCMTMSVGFRAPKQLELLDAYIHTVMEHEQGQKHYADPELNVPLSITEIDAQARQRFKALLLELINASDDLLTETVGRLLTETKPTLELQAEDVIADAAEGDITTMFAQGRHLQRNTYLRFAWAETEHSLNVFVAGEMITTDKALKPFMGLFTVSEVLLEDDWLKIQQNEGATQVLQQMIDLGGWYWA